MSKKQSKSVWNGQAWVAPFEHLPADRVKKETKQRKKKTSKKRP